MNNNIKNITKDNIKNNIDIIPKVQTANLEEKGKVYLVGAGPSDEELLTVKAKRLIEEADVIVYDRLIGQSITLSLPHTAECIDVGKVSGNHTMKQEDINRLLLEKALEGKTVVRLKGGDPFLFGRGGEELELLSKNKVPFEVVPGVTSAIAVPAYNGIPVTHRDAVSSVHIITGHRKKKNKDIFNNKKNNNKDNNEDNLNSGALGNGLADADRSEQEINDINYKALVEVGGTLVFLMGISELENICRGLIDAGMDTLMPAAVLENGTNPGQRRVIGSISTLPELAKQAHIGTPGIIVVGRVVEYSNEFEWYEKLPLFGCRILLTRPKEHMEEMAEKLRRLGAGVLSLPGIRTEAISNSDNEAFDYILSKAETVDYLVFTSRVGVRTFFDAILSKGKDIRSFSRAKIAVIGRGSANELKRYGVLADLMPEIYDAEHLGKLIGEFCRDGDRIFIPRAKKGSELLVKEITEHKKAEIFDIPIYETVYNDDIYNKNKSQLPDLEDVTLVVFTSASTVRSFVRIYGKEDYDYGSVRAVCIGEQTAASAREYGMQTYTAREATQEALIEVICQTYSSIL